MPELRKYSWPSYSQSNGADYHLAYVLVHWAVLTKRWLLYLAKFWNGLFHSFRETEIAFLSKGKYINQL